MAEMSWLNAIKKVLQDADESMHYADIAQAIADKGLRQSFGATPANTVGAYISTSIQTEGEKSPFVRVERGRYSLRQANKATSDTEMADEHEPESSTEDTGLVRAIGMYWNRAGVNWNAPKLLGQSQFTKSDVVNFSEQRGVYLLHDGREVIYVGQAGGRSSDGSLANRLKAHTSDRLSGRWDRFSWFGILGVKDDGELSGFNGNVVDASVLIVTMEALLIEGLEPRQNRQRGEGFKAIEYLQVTDENIESIRRQRELFSTMRELGY